MSPPLLPPPSPLPSTVDQLADWPPCRRRRDGEPQAEWGGPGLGRGKDLHGLLGNGQRTADDQGGVMSHLGAPPPPGPPPDENEQRQAGRDALTRARLLASRLSLDPSFQPVRSEPFTYLLADPSSAPPPPPPDGSQLQAPPVMPLDAPEEPGGIVRVSSSRHLADSVREPAPVPRDLLQLQVNKYVDIARSRVSNITRAANDALTMPELAPIALAGGDGVYEEGVLMLAQGFPTNFASVKDVTVPK